MRREPFSKNSLLGIWQRKTRPRKYYLALLDSIGDNPPEVGISTLRNEQIESIHTNRLETLLKHPPEGELSIASFCPNSTISSGIIHTMPPYSNAHLAVVCIGAIQNLPTLWAEILPEQLRKGSIEEKLACAIDFYLENTDLLPVQIIRLLVKHLRGYFVLMLLFSRQKGQMIIVQRGYSLVLGKNSQTIFFSSDPEVLALFCPSIKFLEENVIVSCDSNEPLLQPNIFPYTG